MRKTILSGILSSCLVGISFGAQALTPDEQTFIQKAATSDQAEITLSQLAVEFYMQILANFPHVLERDFSDQFESVEWDKNESAFRRCSLAVSETSSQCGRLLR
jgi:hypothetical protein